MYKCTCAATAELVVIKWTWGIRLPNLKILFLVLGYYVGVHKGEVSRVMQYIIV